MNDLSLKEFLKEVIARIYPFNIKLKRFSCRSRILTNIFRMFGVPVVKRIFICATHECNANCVHCYEQFIHDKFKKSLTTQQIKNVIDQFYQLGGSEAYFCSGEFLLRDDALDLVRYARSKNVYTIIVTNGLLLDEKNIDDLKEAGLSSLIVSIDSAEATRHDELRGVIGCFKKATNGIRIAKEKGFLVQIWTYITKTNFSELEGISKLAAELGVTVFTFFTLLSGRLFDKFDENLTYEDREKFRKQYNPSSNVGLEFPSEKTPCRGGGRDHICVMPSGDVTFCPPVPYSYGNINVRSIRDCLIDIVKDYKRFSHCKGQCIVNFTEYRQNCNAKFMYE